MSAGEYNFYQNKVKRQFIIDKYQLNQSMNGAMSKTSPFPAQPACTNVDFETGNLSGWTVRWGYNANSMTMQGCCPNIPPFNVANVINGVGNDPYIPAISLVSPLGGSKILQLNDTNSYARAQRVSQTFYVTSGNAIFQVAYCPVLNADEDGVHTCNMMPYVTILLKDSLGNVMNCPKLEVMASGPFCMPVNNLSGWITDPVKNHAGPVRYRPWDVQTFDLSPYMGSHMTIEVSVGDCIGGAHFGYSYFDFKCNALEIAVSTGTSTVYHDATPSTPIQVSTCGSNSAVITAPSGLGPYSWTGPAGSGISNVTTQTISASVAGIYTLTMAPPGLCTGPNTFITKYIKLNVTSTPTLSALVTQPTCANASGSAQINLVAGGVPPLTYEWIPAAATNSNLASGLSPGQTYTVIGVDSAGCYNSLTVSINSFSAAPVFTVNPMNPILTCNTPSVVLSAITGTNTNGYWLGSSTVAQSSPTLAVTSPGTYSVLLTNTVSPGTCSTTVNVVVGTNYSQSAASYSIDCSTTPPQLNAVSLTANTTLNWTDPNLTHLYNPGSSAANGTYTLTATNLTSGCKKTYTVGIVIPDIQVSTTPFNNIITCATTSILATATSSTSGATITWQGPANTTTVNPLSITAAGNYTATAYYPNACATTKTVDIRIDTIVSVSIVAPTASISCTSGSLTLNALNSNSGNYTYTWSPSNPSINTSTLNVTQAGTYTAYVTNETNGCKRSSTFTVYKESVLANFTANPSTGLAPLNVLFSNQSYNANTYSWNLGNSSTLYTISDPSTIYNNAGTYTVTLIATNGTCSDTATQQIIVTDRENSSLVIPNVFTPNNDLVNDAFVIIPVNFSQIQINIFNRWGLQVFESTDIVKISWDGQAEGEAVPDGTYFYIITAKSSNGEEFSYKGTVSLFR
jgi:gliding motility-associated-like protein